MVQFAKRTDWNTESNEIAKVLERLKSDGKQVHDLTVSNPTKCGFKYVHQSLLAPLQDSSALAYEPDAFGPIASRQAVANYYASKDVEIDPKQIVLTSSTSEAYSNIFRLLTNAGDRILVPQPGYPLLQQLAELHDIEILPYEVHFEWGAWKINKANFPKNTEAGLLFILNPSNPCGNFCSKEEFLFIQDFCQTNDISLVCDEVFHDYSFETELPLSATTLSKVLTFTVSGISKVLGLPGMKVGWTCVSGPQSEDALSRLEIINDAYLSAASPQLVALPEWLELRASIQGEIKARLSANYTWLQEELAKSNKYKLYPVQGGWHAVIQLPDIMDDLDFALKLLEEHLVLVHPGYLFDFKESNNLVISLLGEEKYFKEGIHKIIHAISA